MIQEKSAGAIVYNNGKFLLLHYAAGHWDYPKGHIEKGEDEKETARRELEEETGIKDVYFVKDFKESIKYFFRRGKELVQKQVNFYLAETKTKEVKIGTKEHQGYEWLPYKEAVQRVTYRNAKQVLVRANEKLQ